jgi:hypothetical protein
MIIFHNQHVSSEFVTWSCWFWEIIIDFPQTLSLGHVDYGKLSLIFVILCHVVILVMGNYQSMIISHNQHNQVTKSEGNQ